MPTERARINVILRSEQSGGQIAVMDNVVPAGFPGPPLHHHLDETFCVLEGELTFQLEDEIFAKKRGEISPSLPAISLIPSPTSAAPTRGP